MTPSTNPDQEMEKAMGGRPTRWEVWRYYWRYNVAVTPLLIIRVPVMTVAIALIWLGTQLGKLGDFIPGWRG